MLNSLLPKQIATQLKEEEANKKGGERKLIAEGYKEVTVLFSDIVGFTSMASKLSATDLVNTLNDIFSRWDFLCEKYNLEKIKTIGGIF